MANQEEKNTANENKEQGTAGADNNQNTGNDTSSTNGHKKDPVHNTGDERMMIDESGAEVKPNDQV